MNRAPAPVTYIEEMTLNRLWAAPLTRLSFNHLAVSGCTVAVPSDQLGRLRWRVVNSTAAPCPLRWPNPWTLCARRAKIFRAAHDGTHSSRAERGRRGGRDRAARRLGHRRAHRDRH